MPSNSRSPILRRALDLASVRGLDQLTIGTIATGTNRSKSGILGLFGSRTELQLAVLDEAETLFRQLVVEDARTLARSPAECLVVFAEAWSDWPSRAGLAGGCLFLAGSPEFDDTPGPVHDWLQAFHGRARALMVAWAAEPVHGGVSPAAAADAEITATLVMGLLLAHQHEARLMRQADASARFRQALARLLARP